MRGQVEIDTLGLQLAEAKDLLQKETESSSVSRSELAWPSRWPVRPAAERAATRTPIRSSCARCSARCTCAARAGGSASANCNRHPPLAR